MSPNKNDLSLLVEKALSGDSSVWVAIYNAIYKDIHYICIGFLKNEDDAQDAEQETFMKVIQNIGSLKNRDNFLTWAKQIAANTSLNFLKKRRDITFSDIEERLSPDDDSCQFDPEDVAVDFRPEEQADIKETSRLIHEMMLELPDEQRISLELLYGSELTIKEIAIAMNCTENTVKSRLRYGKATLQEKIKALEKKGTKLVAVPLLVLLRNLFKTDMEAYASEGGKSLVESMLNEILSHKSHNDYEFEEFLNNVADPDGHDPIENHNAAVEHEKADKAAEKAEEKRQKEAEKAEREAQRAEESAKIKETVEQGIEAAGKGIKKGWSTIAKAVIGVGAGILAMVLAINGVKYDNTSKTSEEIYESLSQEYSEPTSNNTGGTAEGGTSAQPASGSGNSGKETEIPSTDCIGVTGTIKSTDACFGREYSDLVLNAYEGNNGSRHLSTQEYFVEFDSPINGISTASISFFDDIGDLATLVGKTLTMNGTLEYAGDCDNGILKDYSSLDPGGDEYRPFGPYAFYCNEVINALENVVELSGTVFIIADKYDSEITKLLDDKSIPKPVHCSGYGLQLDSPYNGFTEVELHDAELNDTLFESMAGEHLSLKGNLFENDSYQKICPSDHEGTSFYPIGPYELYVLNTEDVSY